MYCKQCAAAEHRDQTSRCHRPVASPMYASLSPQPATIHCSVSDWHYVISIAMYSSASGTASVGHLSIISSCDAPRRQRSNARSAARGIQSVTRARAARVGLCTYKFPLTLLPFVWSPYEPYMSVPASVRGVSRRATATATSASIRSRLGSSNPAQHKSAARAFATTSIAMTAAITVSPAPTQRAQGEHWVDKTATKFRNPWASWHEPVRLLLDASRHTLVCTATDAAVGDGGHTGTVLLHFPYASRHSCHLAFAVRMIADEQFLSKVRLA